MMAPLIVNSILHNPVPLRFPSATSALSAVNFSAVYFFTASTFGAVCCA